MLAELKKSILRLFPELSGGLHVDRYGRVMAIADPPQEGSSAERFRPRLAVDIEILTPDMEPDKDFPQYTAVPVPVPFGAGGEAGGMALPEPGALVLVGFAYGRQDHPIIKQLYGMGDSLPAVQPKELLLQRSPEVFQRADAGGNWQRQTNAGIQEESYTRSVKAAQSTVQIGTEKKTVSEHAALEVAGAHTVEVGTMLSMVAGARADLGTLGALNLTAGADSSHTTAGKAVETVGGNHSSTVKKNREVTVQGGRTENVNQGQQTTIGKGKNEKIGADLALDVGGSSTEMVTGDKSISAADIGLAAKGSISLTSSKGGGNTSLFMELLWALDDIKAALDVLAGHDHPDAGTINQGASVQSSSTDLGRHRGNIAKVTR